MSKLSTHVLDTSRGVPAAGMTIDLYSGSGNERQKVKTLISNADGRCDEPLLADAEFKIGHWELDFYVADYFRAQGTELTSPPFLEIVTLRFGIADAGANYHVPLLVSPWSYSTYRGS